MSNTSQVEHLRSVILTQGMSDGCKLLRCNRTQSQTFLPPEVFSGLARSLLSLLVDLERLPVSLSLGFGDSEGLALLLCLEEPV